MSLAIRTMRAGAAYLRHQLPIGAQLAASALSKPKSITKTASSRLFLFDFSSRKASSQSSNPLTCRVEIPRPALQSATPFRFFSNLKDRSDATLYFPDSVTMTQYLSNHPLLKQNYYQEKGITKAIAELAAERFADCGEREKGVKIGTVLLINDLQAGKDGFTGNPLPNLGKLGLSSMFWTQILMATEQALLDCANSVKVNS